MEVELMMPSPAIDFNFESTNTSPYTTAPSSPQRIASFFYSAPTSPTRVSIPLKKLQQDEDQDDYDDDFAFDFSGQLEPPSISAADELFYGGKIKPLQFSNDPPKSPASRFTEALNQTPGDQTKTKTNQNPPQRGRERTTTATPTTRDKVSRSLSPFRVSDIMSDEENNQKNPANQSSSLTWYNKWNLKNLLLFRSASEGSGTTSKDTLKKYSTIRKGDQNSSFRSTDSGGSVGESRRRVMRKVSAHEIHYTANRALAEEMRKKTSLPYKSGLLGCLGLHNNGGSVHEISRGIGSVMRQRGE